MIDGKMFTLLEEKTPISCIAMLEMDSLKI